MTAVVSPALGPRSQRILPSHLHEMHRLVETRRESTLALHVGEPFIRMPQMATEAFVRAIHDGQTSYTDAPGLLKLREQICERHGLGYSPDRTFVTPGSCQALSAVFLALAAEGGKVLVPDIHWPIHIQQIQAAGMEPQYYSLDDLGNEPEATLDRSNSDAVMGVLLNSPANPSGQVLSSQAVQRVHRWCLEHRVPLISDEAYEDFVYVGAHVSPMSWDAHLPPSQRVVYAVHTFSKGFSMTGCRLGYVLAPNSDASARLHRIQESVLVAPSTPVQYAGIAALTDTTHIARHHAYVAHTAAIVREQLAEANLLWREPEGGWYALANLEAAARVRARDWAIAALAATGVSVTPGYGFFRRGDSRGDSIIRVSLCGEFESTRLGVERLIRYLRSPE